MFNNENLNSVAWTGTKLVAVGYNGTLLTSEDGATWMMLRNRGEPTGFAGLAAPLLATAVRRATSNDLARLKSLLEAANLS